MGCYGGLTSAWRRSCHLAFFMIRTSHFIVHYLVPLDTSGVADVRQAFVTSFYRAFLGALFVR